MATLKNIKIGITENNLIELKQLWYGITEKDVDKVKINCEALGIEFDENAYYNSVYSDYACENKFTYVESPERDLSGQLHNDDITTFYVPTATFTFSYVNEDVYAKIIQTVNTKNFFVEYYDYEIQKTVVRDMYMTEQSLGALHRIGANLRGFTSVKLTFVSRKSYPTYDDLKA